MQALQLPKPSSRGEIVGTAVVAVLASEGKRTVLFCSSRGEDRQAAAAAAAAVIQPFRIRRIASCAVQTIRCAVAAAMLP